MKTVVASSLGLLVLLAGAVGVGLELGRIIRPPAPPAPLAPRDWPVLTVTVTDLSTQPIPGARVSLFRRTPRREGRAGGGPTGVRGRATYRLIPDRYRVSAQAPGRAAGEAEVDLRGGDGQVRIVLKPAITITGRVVDRAGAGLAEVEVSIRWRGGERKTLTGPDGAYRVDDLPHAPGRAWVVDTKAPRGLWRPPESRRVLRASPRIGGFGLSDIRLLATGQLEGTLTGKRRGEAEVYLTNRWCRDALIDLPGKNWFHTVRPDDRGRFRATLIPPGRIEAYLLLDGAPKRLGVFRVESGQTVNLGPIAVPDGPKGQVAGYLRWIKDQPTGGGVRLVTDLKMRQAAPDGRFEIGGLIGDRVLLLGGVRFEEHYLMFREEVDVGATDLELRLGPERRIRFAFTDAESGKPVRKRSTAVSVGDPPGPGSGFYLIQEGLWTYPLTPGRHSVRVRVQGYEPVLLENVQIERYRETRLDVALSRLP